MPLFSEISLILLIAVFVAVVMRLLRQPLLLGHIITGALVGPLVFDILRSTETVETFSRFGIAILLFIVGLGLSPKIIREVGKVSLIAGLVQIIFTTFFGFLIARFFDYDLVSSLYIAIALTFSSTIIVLKLLAERRDIEKLYGRISIGLLLVQDIAATIVLLLISTSAMDLVPVFIKGAILMLVLSFVSARILPKLSEFFSSSGEFLFLFSIGWGFGLATLFYYIGFSIEVGALLAGIALSFAPYSQEAASKLKPLRDFFLIMFFVLLGARFVIPDVRAVIPQAVAFSLFVLVGKPLVVLILMELLGYNRKTSLMSGLTVAQVSEFSLVIVLVGVQIGHIPNSILSFITLVGIIAIAASSYMVIGADKLYKLLKNYIGIFERKRPNKEFDILSSYDVVLFGCSRVGYDFIEAFKNLGQGFLCIDYDPKLVRQLTEEGVNCRYGDVEDVEFLLELNLHNAKMVICTIPDFEASKLLLDQVKQNPDVIVIMVSYSIEDSLKLYEHGADYIIMPHFIGSAVIAEMVGRLGFDIAHFGREREKHVKYLKERKRLGHTHPKFEV